MKKISLILMAYHHVSGNVAGQRFKGLLKYLPKDKYDLHVITAEPSCDWHEDSGGINVISIKAPLLSKKTIFYFPFMVGKMFGIFPRMTPNFFVNNWIERGVEEGRRVARMAKERGDSVVIMGTYSPIDALIAAKFLADESGAPLIQDFRDGLVFESLGRQGWVYHQLRKFLEKRVIRTAICITTVSRPLVKYFEVVYKPKRVSLLYNGFDSDYVFQNADQGFGGNGDGNLRLGHFGRIAASDAKRLSTLKKFLEYLSDQKMRSPLILDFFGTLTKDEVELIEASSLNNVLHGQVSRAQVFKNMERMSALLLVTGDQVGVATGKIFEYLFSGRRIIMATQCRNEAAQILDEIGDDDVVIDFSDSENLPSVEELKERLRRPFRRNIEKINKFKKSEQAEYLSHILMQANCKKCDVGIG